MKTTDFDRIAAAAPLDRQASVVRDASGDQWSARVPRDTQHWSAPPLPERAMPPHIENLAGRTFGRIGVVRYHASHPKAGARWLVRCCCGDYEIRTSRAIRKADPGDSCCACRTVDQLRRRGGRNTSRGRAEDVHFLDGLADASAARMEASDA